jgi:hypothetical protein
MTAVDRRQGYRRTRRSAVLVGCIGLLTFVATEPGGATADRSAAPFSPGTGNAVALGYKVNPAFGGLSFGITAGESIAGHQNTAAQAQSKAVNLGVIGVTLAGEGCEGDAPILAEKDQPQPVVVSSDEAGAAEGKSGDEAGAITMFSRATKTPFAESITKVAPVGEPALAVISGATTHATSGVVAPGVREAHAITEIGSLKLLNGAIVLGDMRWDAMQRTGAKTEDSASFEVGSLTIAGVKTPLPGDGVEQLRFLDATLSALGFQIIPPTIRREQGIVFVDPMVIGVIPSELRDGLLLGPLLSAAQPIREDFTETLFRLGCGGDLSGLYAFPSSTAVTVLDLAVGSVSGAGSLNLELGGVQATTADLGAFEGLGDLPALPALPDLPAAETPELGTTDGLGTDVAAPPAGDTSESGGGSSAPVASSPISALEGKRGGALLGVGAGGLLLLLASAEVDRRKMFRAQREIPLEA